MNIRNLFPKCWGIVFTLIVVTGCASQQPGSGNLAYDMYGDGPGNVIVLHDWLGDRHNYDDARPYLDTKGFTYAFADVRGYGGSMDLAGPFTAAQVSMDTLALANKLGWDRFHIIGHSMTGMVVQRIAADAPARVISVIATTPVAAGGMQTDPKTRGFLEAAAKDPAITAKAVQALTGNQHTEVWGTVKAGWTMASSTQAARLGYLDMFDRADFHKDVDGLKVPITVILGENDLPFFQPEYINNTFAKWYPNLTIVISKNAGHYPMQETPVFYASAVNRHLQENAIK